LNIFRKFILIIIGIDPGLATIGYGVVEKTNNNGLKPINYGCVITKPDLTLPKRLAQIYSGIAELIEKYDPDVCAVEELFFAKNVKTAISVAQARGVILLPFENSGIPLFEYTPKQVKQAIVGYGHAEKQQIQYMVKVLLNLDAVPKPDDAADALAIAICHGNIASGQNSFAIK